MNVNNYNELVKHTEDIPPRMSYLQEEEISSPQNGEEQKSLHVYLCHLQSEFYRRILFVVYLISVQDLMPAMPSHHTKVKQRITNSGVSRDFRNFN